MTLNFYKFQGAGNDFILIDNRKGEFSISGLQTQEGIAGLCHRNMGIGADGLMLLQEEPGMDFRMIYYNSDGLEGTMCGNGGRCLVAFAHWLGIFEGSCSFMAIDGLHKASILGQENNLWRISLQMQEASLPILSAHGYQVDTGSPHLVVFLPNISNLDVVAEGRRIRYSPDFLPRGINVNFVKVINDQTLHIRTYERGVENETLACGTGAVAAAIAARSHGIINNDNHYILKAPGGELQVSFTPPILPQDPIKNILLNGPAQLVFSGMLYL